MPLSLYLLAVAVFAMGTSEFMLAGLVPDIAASLDVSIGAAGLLTSAFAVGMVVGAPLMAALDAPVAGPATACWASCSVFAVDARRRRRDNEFRDAARHSGDRRLGQRRLPGRGASVQRPELVPADRKGRALAVLLSGTTAGHHRWGPGRRDARHAARLAGHLLGDRTALPSRCRTAS